jgi:hypothetical protein
MTSDTRRDRDHSAGMQVYRPPAPPCVCGHWQGFHQVTGPITQPPSFRGGCVVHDDRGRCSCKKYTPKLAPAGGAAEHRPPPAGAVQS